MTIFASGGIFRLGFLKMKHLKLVLKGFLAVCCFVCLSTAANVAQIQPAAKQPVSRADRCALAFLGYLKDNAKIAAEGVVQDTVSGTVTAAGKEVVKYIMGGPSYHILKKKRLYEGENLVISSSNLPSHLLLTGPEYTSAKNRFRKSYNSAVFKGDERYVSYSTGDKLFQVVYRVDRIFGSDLILSRFNESGKLKQFVTNPKDNLLHEMEVSAFSKAWFNRLKDFPKKVKFDIPQTNEEKVLRKKGYRDIFINGIDEMNWIQAMGRNLRKHNINPYATHIVNFADRIESYIGMVREGISSSKLEDAYRMGGHPLVNKDIFEMNPADIPAVKSRLDILDKYFIKEARQRVKQEEVTLKWFLLWTYRLSILATLPVRRGDIEMMMPGVSVTLNKSTWWHTDKEMTKLLNRGDRRELSAMTGTITGFLRNFPYEIVIPTIKDMGIIALNRANISGITSVTLSGRSKILDAQTLVPAEQIRHDLGHVHEYEHGKAKWASSVDIHQFHKIYMEEVKKLSLEKREMVELGYTLLLHDSKRNEYFVEKPQSILKMYKNFFHLFQNRLHLGAALPENVDVSSGKEVSAYIKKAAQAFSGTARKIIQQINSPPKQH